LKGERKTIRTRYGPFVEEVLDEAEITHHPPEEGVKYKIQRKKVAFSEKDPIHKGLVANDRIDLEYIGAKRRPWALIPENEFADLIEKAIEKGVLSEKFVERLKQYMR
jgi:hypothetical protein